MSEPSRDRTPILSADGIHYCSPACGGGKFCTKSDYDNAVKHANDLVAALGEGWSTDIWENLGWHYAAKNKCMKVYAHRNHGGGWTYSAWIEPDVEIGNAVVQIIEYSDDPNDALGTAKQKAWEVIHRIRAALTDLEDVL